MADEYPILELGTALQINDYETWEPPVVVKIINLWVDEDGETQLRIKEGCDAMETKQRVVTPVDVYERLDNSDWSELEPVEEPNL